MKAEGLKQLKHIGDNYLWRSLEAKEVEEVARGKRDGGGRVEGAGKRTGEGAGGREEGRVEVELEEGARNATADGERTARGTWQDTGRKWGTSSGRAARQDSGKKGRQGKARL